MLFRIFLLFLFLSSLPLNAYDLVAPPSLFAPAEQRTFTFSQISKVNLITGEYCEDECDLIVAGIEPLSIRRFYNHFSGSHERVYGHWRVNPETFMLFNFESLDKSKPFVGVGQSI